MFCGNCGKENREDARFCLNCGMRIQALREQRVETEEPQEAAPEVVEEAVCEETAAEEIAEEAAVEEAPKKKKGKKWLIIAIAAVVLAAVGVGVWYFFLRPKEESIYPAGIFYAFDTEDGQAVVYGGKVVLESTGKIDVTNNVDGKAAACKTEDGLYLLTEQGSVKITEEKGEYGTIRVAPNGVAVAYEVDDSLYLYDSETKATVEVADLVRHFTISPDGKYVVYLNSDGLYRWNGETEKLDENDNKYEYYLSISNTGMIYVFGRGGEVKGAQAFGAEEAVAYALYCFDEKGECSIVKDGWTGNQPLYNKLQNQIIFAASSDGMDCNLYISENGQPAAKLLKDTNSTFGASVAYGTLYQGPISAETGHVCNMEDFRGQILQGYTYNDNGEAALFYMNEELEANVILGYSQYSFSMLYERAYDNSYVYAGYNSDDRRLYRIDGKTGEKERLEKDVYWFASAGEGVVYYLDEDMTLYRWNDGETERLAKDIGRMQFIGTDDGGVLYRDKEDVLWYADKNGEPEKVDQKVRKLWRDGSGFYYVKEDGSVRFSEDGTDFAKIEGVTDKAS